MKSDLSRVKAGDNIWTIQSGWIIVKCSDSSFDREPIVDMQGDSYTVDGKWCEYDINPSAFTYNPFEKIEELEAKVKELEQRLEQAGAEVVLVRWERASSLWYRDSDALVAWRQMKELPKMTAQEAADKLGITVEELKELQ